MKGPRKAKTPPPKSDTRKPTPEDLLIGRRLKDLRRQAGRNQEWLARELGITYQQLGKYERGESSLKVWMLAKATTLLGVPGTALLDAITQPGFAESARPYESEASAKEAEFRQCLDRVMELWPSIRRG